MDEPTLAPKFKLRPEPFVFRQVKIPNMETNAAIPFTGWKIVEFFMIFKWLCVYPKQFLYEAVVTHFYEMATKKFTSKKFTSVGVTSSKGLQKEGFRSGIS
jgi:hypothetical protein